jgi:hypothetical protein
VKEKETKVRLWLSWREEVAACGGLGMNVEVQAGTAVFESS